MKKRFSIAFIYVTIFMISRYTSLRGMRMRACFTAIYSMEIAVSESDIPIVLQTCDGNFSGRIRRFGLLSAK